MRPLKNGNFCSSSRKANISTTGIYRIFRGLKFEPDAEIGQKVPFCKDLKISATGPVVNLLFFSLFIVYRLRFFITTKHTEITENILIL